MEKTLPVLKDKKERCFSIIFWLKVDNHQYSKKFSLNFKVIGCDCQPRYIRLGKEKPLKKPDKYTATEDNSIMCYLQ